MSDTSQDGTPPGEEHRYRRIILGREIGPRSPKWQMAWKRTLFSYVERLSGLANKEQKAG